MGKGASVEPASWRSIVLAILPTNPIGLLFALVFFVWSMTPSLLPRVWFMQALATGLSVGFGYGIGVLVSMLAGAAMDRIPAVSSAREWLDRWSRLGWITLGILATVLIPTFLVLGARWQTQIHQLVGLPGEHEFTYLGVLLLAALVWLVLVLLWRGARAVSLRLARQLRRILPPVVSRLISSALVVALIVVTVQGITERVFRTTLESSFALIDQESAPGVEPPESSLRSGSPDSPQFWDSLGYQGRSFVASGPSAEAISEVTGRPAQEPIRVYAGLESADSLDGVADNVIAELHRTGAFERESLLVATTTGRGWVNEAVADGFEYANNGDSAIAAMQYSFLPSPVAFLANRESPREAGQALFDKIYAEWEQLPEDSRPNLLVYGESLGAFGGQAAFADSADMLDRVDGGLFIGPPHFTDLWAGLTASRDDGSKEFLPVIDEGMQIRFFSKDDDLQLPGDWSDESRIVFWQHPGDAIVWWNFGLLHSKPDWLREELPDDIHPDIRWIPFVTFWQVTMDMAFAAEVPDGFGHTYGADSADLWAAIIQPEWWNDEAADNARAALNEIMDERIGPDPSAVANYN